MTKIKVGIAGCLGRMGQELIKKILADKNFVFVGGFEHKSHQGIGKKISDVTNIINAYAAVGIKNIISLNNWLATNTAKVPF